MTLPPDWSLPLPAYESIDLRFPLPTDVLARIEAERPDVIHVATPGPIGVCGLAVARLLGIPVVGSYHTELGPYALHLTRDLLVAEAIDVYVDWFYRQCATVLAPTRPVAEALRAARSPECRRLGPRRRLRLPARSAGTRSCARGCSATTATCCCSRSGGSRTRSGSTSCSTRSRCSRGAARTLRLAIAGDGPARRSSRRTAPAGTRLPRRARGDELARLYASADVFCFPSTTDTFGQVLLEAGASGLPVVAAAHRRDARARRAPAQRPARPAGRPGAFAAALRELADEPGAARRPPGRSRAARARARAHLATPRSAALAPALRETAPASTAEASLAAA